MILSFSIYHQSYRKIFPLEKVRPWARWFAARYADAPNVFWNMTPEATPEFVPIIQAARGRHPATRRRPAPGHLQARPRPVRLELHARGALARLQQHPDVEGREPHRPHGDERLRAFAREARADGGRRLRGGNRVRLPRDPAVGPPPGVLLVPPRRSPRLRSQRRVAHPPHVEEGAVRARRPADGDSPKIFEARREWWLLVPDQSVLAAGGKTDGDIPTLAARHERGAWVMVYLAEPGACTVAMDRLKPSAVEASWIDPRTGTSTPIGRCETTGTRSSPRPRGGRTRCSSSRRHAREEARGRPLGKRHHAAGRRAAVGVRRHHRRLHRGARRPLRQGRGVRRWQPSPRPGGVRSSSRASAGRSRGRHPRCRAEAHGHRRLRRHGDGDAHAQRPRRRPARRRGARPARGARERLGRGRRGCIDGCRGGFRLGHVPHRCEPPGIHGHRAHPTSSIRIPRAP